MKNIINDIIYNINNINKDINIKNNNIINNFNSNINVVYITISYYYTQGSFQSATFSIPDCNFGTLTNGIFIIIYYSSTLNGHYIAIPMDDFKREDNEVDINFDIEKHNRDFNNLTSKNTMIQ